MLLTVSACATSRSEISMAQPARLANPDTGTAVAIVRVDDLRHFQISPPEPSTPSLTDDKIGDTAITSRAIARKRNGYGMALGDVLLAKGETVADIVQLAVADGFRKAGYRVISAGEPGYDKAVPVTLRVGEFWSWFTPGLIQVTIANRADITLNGALPALTPDLIIHSEVNDQMMAVYESDWQKITARALDQVSDKVAEALKQKSGPRIS